MTIKCQQCNHPNQDDVEFCENCGAQLAVSMGTSTPQVQIPAVPSSTAAPDNLICPNCKAPYTTGDVFCFNCGYDLTKLPAVRAPQPVAAVPAPQPSPVSSSVPMPPPTERQSGPTQTGIQVPAPQVATPAANPAQPDPRDGMSTDEFDKLLETGQPFVEPPAPAPVPVQVTPVPAVSAPVSSQTAQVSKPATTATSFPPAPSRMTLNISGPYGLETVVYSGKELLLGRRDPKTRIFPDVNLDDAASSRRHLSIWQEEGDGYFYAQDLESSNGTMRNGQDMPPGEPVQLADSDVIKVGTRYTIQVRIT